MARSKRQPVQREASSEFFNKKTATWEETNEKSNGHVTNGQIGTNGDAKANGKLADAIEKVNDVEKKDSAGFLQLVIAVVGIYASLYVRTPGCYEERIKGRESLT